MSQTSPTTPRVFISYRRAESGGHAGRLYDAMTERFGARNVFMDVDLQPGVDFVERITAAVGACHVLLVVMGPDWARAAPGAPQPRIAEPDDVVRLEVATALRRSDVTVIPVLVEKACMPDPDDLPADLRSLTRRNALELSDLRWRSDVARLIGVMETLLLQTPPVPPAAVGAAAPAGGPAPAKRPSRLRRRSLLGVVAVAVVALVVGLALRPQPGGDERAAGVPADCDDAGDAELKDMSATRHWRCVVASIRTVTDPSLSYFEYRTAAGAQAELWSTLRWLTREAHWDECEKPWLERSAHREAFCVVSTARGPDKTIKPGTIAIFWRGEGSRAMGRATFDPPTQVPAAVEDWSRRVG